MKKLLLFMTVFCGMVLAVENAQVVKFSRVGIVHDGIPDESFWSRAGTVENFCVFKKFPTPASVKTTVRFCMDMRNLYVALICDEPAGVNTGDPRSHAWSGDHVEIFFASLDGKDWYRQLVFGLNGKRYIEFADAGQLQWKHFIGKNYWSAELIIPLAQLGKFGQNDLRFNMFRFRRNVKERYTWCDLPWAHDPEKFKTLEVFEIPEEITHGPWEYATAADSVKIGWETTGKCNPMLFYRKKGASSFIMVPAARIPDLPETLHHANLTGLESDTEYEYHFGGDRKLYTFRTLAVKPADFSFAMISDTHCRSQAMQILVEKEVIRNADILIHLGDMVSGVSGRGCLYDGFLDGMLKSRDKVFFALRGNHEYRGVGVKAFDQLFSPAEKTGYGMFSHKGVCFIYLDTDGDVPIAKEYLDRQQQWLKKAVTSEEFTKAQFRVLLAHHPLYPSLAPELTAMFRALPEKAQKSFDIMFAGHTHLYEKLTPGSDVLYSTHPRRNGMKVNITLPFPVLTIKELGCFVVDKSDDKLVLKVYSPENTIMDTVTVRRNTGK
ncbi:MAG: hypothetical protein E7058_07675 [Lentisphaerae bacterium]|nr:hypothetical protein [Lentisphaerota bacterium]